MIMRGEDLSLAEIDQTVIEGTSDPSSAEAATPMRKLKLLAHLQASCSSKDPTVIREATFKKKRLRAIEAWRDFLSKLKRQPLTEWWLDCHEIEDRIEKLTSVGLDTSLIEATLFELCEISLKYSEETSQTVDRIVRKGHEEMESKWLQNESDITSAERPITLALEDQKKMKKQHTSKLKDLTNQINSLEVEIAELQKQQNEAKEQAEQCHNHLKILKEAETASLQALDKFTQAREVNNKWKDEEEIRYKQLFSDLEAASAYKENMLAPLRQSLVDILARLDNMELKQLDV